MGDSCSFSYPEHENGTSELRVRIENQRLEMESLRKDLDRCRAALEAWQRYHENPDVYPVTEKAPWLLAEEALGLTKP